MTANQSTPKVLIVDDRPENLLAMEQILIGLDIDLARAGSGNEALTKMIHDDFALVLLDVQMPEMDGIEVASLMRDRNATRHTPIIFVTALDNGTHHQFKGYEAGAVDFLHKPIDPDILRSKVSVFLRLYHQRQELEREITERKRAEMELQQSERKLRSLYGSTSDAVMLQNEKGFFDCNDAAVRMLGCKDKAEICTRHPGELSPAKQPCGTDSVTQANQHAATAIKNGRQQFEWMCKRQDTGAIFPVEVLLRGDR